MLGLRPRLGLRLEGSWVCRRGRDYALRYGSGPDLGSDLGNGYSEVELPLRVRGAKVGRDATTSQDGTVPWVKARVGLGNCTQVKARIRVTAGEQYACAPC